MTTCENQNKYLVEDLKIFFISDVHLFNRRTTITYMLKNLYKYAVNETIFKDIDMFVISGDLLDRELPLGDTRVLEFQSFLIKLVNLCIEHNVKLRILEGTPSHDRRQPAQLNTILKAHPKGAKVDAKYVDTLSIERVPDWGLDIMYLPDEWHNDHDVIYEQVIELLHSKGLSQVDILVMHGMFDYQLPDGLNLPCHSTERYLALVKHYISIGHWHKASFLDKIFAQGSFDRISFNEEEMKGGVLAYINLLNPSKNKTKFIENKNAKIYKNINIVGLDKPTVIKRLSEADSLPFDSFVRVELNKGTELLSLVDSMISERPNLNWSKKFAKEKIKVKDGSVIPGLVKVTPINERTIGGLVSDKLKAKNSSETTTSRIIDLLDALNVGKV